MAKKQSFVCPLSQQQRLKNTGVYQSRGETIAASWNVFQSVNADWRPLEMVGVARQPATVSFDDRVVDVPRLQPNVASNPVGPPLIFMNPAGSGSYLDTESARANARD